VTAQEKARYFITHPAALGRALGYTDFRDDLHGGWIRRMVTNDDDMTLQAHRGSYKTTCLCVAISLLMLWHPDQNIIFLRKTDSDVAEVIKTVNRILSTDIMRDIYHALTGGELAIARDNSSEITLNIYAAPRGAAQLQGIGIGGSITGKHADIIITDDIVNLKDRISRAERERTKAVYMELQNICNPGGRFINTGTPWHKEDAFELMPDPEQWDCYSTGMLDKEQLDDLRKSMSPSLFAANYELRHIAQENALFTTPPTFMDDASLLKDGVAHIDAAYGGEDYTAFTCGKRVGDTLYMYGRMWHTHVDTVLDKIIADCQRLKCGPIMCESNADKNFLAKEIMRSGYKARPYTEHENKYLKIAEYLRKWWGNIVWLEGTDRDYLAQIMDYTEDAEHDDAPDSASVVCRYYDRRRGTKYESPFGG
jgi:hypothetical protein